MSLTKDGFDNIEGQMFEVIRGVEGDCLTLGDEDGGTRISGPKPWGGGQVVKTFATCEKYGPIERLEAENAKLRELLEAILQCAGETKRDKGCDACPMFNGDEAGAYLNKNWCLLRPTMHELGIEVPHD